MRIAIDVHMVGERETGNETYTLNLVRHLLELDTRNTYGLITPHPERLLAKLDLPAHAEVLRVRPDHILPGRRNRAGRGGCQKGARTGSPAESSPDAADESGR